MSFWERMFDDHGPEWGVVLLGFLPPAVLVLRLLDIQGVTTWFLLRPYGGGGAVIFVYLALAVLWTLAQIGLIRRRGQRAYGTLWMTPVVLGPALLMGPMMAACEHMNVCL